MASENRENVYDDRTLALSAAYQFSNSQGGAATASSNQPIFDRFHTSASSAPGVDLPPPYSVQKPASSFPDLPPPYSFQTPASSLPDLPPPYQPTLQGQQPTFHQQVGGPAAYYSLNTSGQSPQEPTSDWQLTSDQLPVSAAEIRDESCRWMCTPHVALSCFVFWLCGMVIGLVAFIIAIVAQSKTLIDATLARRLGYASVAVSIVGIVVGVVILAAVLGTQLSAHTSCPGTQFYVDGKCFQYRASQYNTNDCNMTFSEATYYDPEERYCYYNCSNYVIGETCYNFRAESHRCDPAFQGKTYYDPQQGYCYYKCQNFFIGGACYNFKVESDRCDSAFQGTTYYDRQQGCCYYKCSNYFVGGTCYHFRVQSDRCSLTFHGKTYYDPQQGYWYYNCSNYLAGGTCYNFRVQSDRCDPTFQGTTYYDQQQGYCYYKCSNFFILGTCYNFRVDIGYDSSCRLYSSYIDRPYCYFNCTSFYADGRCFTARSSDAAYSHFSCSKAFVSATYYDGIKYCYYNYSSSACKSYEYFAGGFCFRNRSNGYASSSSCSASFSNIDG